MAEKILDGQWLGDTYINRHLAKGCGYPVLIVIQNLLGLSLHQMAWLLYSLGCLLMVFALRPVIKYRILQLLCFFFLLFCPDFDMSLIDTYRFWVQSWQLLFIYSSLTAIFLRRNNLKAILWWTVPGILGTVFYWHSLENGFWTIALYPAAALLIAGFSLSDGDTWKRCCLKFITVMLPLLFVLLSSLVISTVNCHKYGFFGTTIFNGGNFPRMMKAIYSVKPSSNQYNLPVAVPREVFQRIYKVSPTLASYEKNFERAFDSWGIYVRFPDDNEVETGWLYWSILSHFEKMDFKKQDKIFEDAAAEIERALKDGRLERRPTMPSVLMAPWRNEYGPSILQLTPEFLANIKQDPSLNALVNYTAWLNLQKPDNKLIDIARFSTVYRDTFWINKEVTPLQMNRLNAEISLAKFWMWANPFFFYLTAFCLLGLLFLACFSRKKEIFYLCFIPLSIIGGMAVLLFGFIYVHVSSFPTWGYLLPVRELLKILCIVTVSAFFYSLFNKNTFDLPRRFRELGWKQVFKTSLPYTLLAVLLLSSAGIFGLSRWLDIKTPYMMNDLSPKKPENEAEICPITDKNWLNGGCRYSNILLLRNTPRNRKILKRKRFFSLGSSSDKILILNISENGSYLWLHYSGKRLKLKDGIKNTVFVGFTQ